MTTYNLTEVRIGRNIKNEPMAKGRWVRFQDDIVASLRFFAGTVEADEFWTEVHHGSGTWDGVEEESAVVTLYWSEHGLNDADALVRIALADLENDASIFATRYEQDAIAVVHGGRSTLVKAKAVLA